MRTCFKKINTKVLTIFITIMFILININSNLKNNENSNYTNEIVNVSNELNFINSENIINKEIWKLEIPKINLTADIAEGTSEEILNKYVGHFEESQNEFGNIALAAHNRGYPVNYFRNLKKLEIGDEIYYTYNGIKNIYKVITKKIIKETEVEILENTKENILTLITCVENEPKLRRCIQAIKTI